MPAFREFAERLSEPCFQADRDGVVTWANRRWGTGVVGRRFIDLVPPADADRVSRVWTRVWEDEHAHECVVSTLGAGRLAWTLVATDGTVCGLSRRAGPAPSASERERMLLMGERMSRTGYWSIELATGKAFWSDEIYRIHGYEPGEVEAAYEVGLRHFSAEDAARVQAIADRAVAAREAYEFEFELTRTDGAKRIVQCFGQPDVDAVTGEVDRLFGVFRDVTDDDRTQRMRELEHFAYIAAHDLRGPVRNIRSFVELLFQDLDLPPRRVAFRDQVLGATRNRLRALVDGIGQYARSGGRLEVGTVVLADVVSTSVTDVSAALDEVSATLAVAGGFPDVRGNEVALRQVFDNLLRNAIRFRDPSRPLEVTIRGIQSGGRVAVRIEDNGIGIPDNLVGYVFELFRRLDPRSPGTGIGLTVSQRLVERCGGTLRVVDGGHGVGATFEVSLPLA